MGHFREGHNIYKKWSLRYWTSRSGKGRIKGRIMSLMIVHNCRRFNLRPMAGVFLDPLLVLPPFLSTVLSLVFRVGLVKLEKYFNFISASFLQHVLLTSAADLCCWPVLLTCAADQCCWPVLLTCAADLCCWPISWSRPPSLTWSTAGGDRRPADGWRRRPIGVSVDAAVSPSRFLSVLSVRRRGGCIFTRPVSPAALPAARAASATVRRCRLYSGQLLGQKGGVKEGVHAERRHRAGSVIGVVPLPPLTPPPIGHARHSGQGAASQREGPDAASRPSARAVAGRFGRTNGQLRGESVPG